MNDKKHILNNKTYDFLKYFVEIIVPGFGTLYFTLGTLWGFPRGDEVVGTCAAVALFLGLFVAYARRSYDKSDAKYDGTVETSVDDDGKTFSLNLDGDPYEIDQQKELRLKVDPQ